MQDLSLPLKAPDRSMVRQSDFIFGQGFRPKVIFAHARREYLFLKF